MLIFRASFLFAYNRSADHNAAVDKEQGDPKSQISCISSLRRDLILRKFFNFLSQSVNPTQSGSLRFRQIARLIHCTNDICRFFITGKGEYILNRLAVQRNRFKVLIVDCHLFGHIICAAVDNTNDFGCGGIKGRTIRADEGDIAGIVYNGT